MEVPMYVPLTLKFAILCQHYHPVPVVQEACIPCQMLQIRGRVLRSGRQASSLPVGPMLAFETLMPLQPLTGYMLRLEIFTVSAMFEVASLTLNKSI